MMADLHDMRAVMIATDQVALIKDTLDEHKGLDIKDIDVTELTDVADFIVICTANSSRHAQTLVDKTTRKMREAGIRAMGSEGAAPNDDWLLIDFGDVIVHVMLASAREFYSLEKLWGMTQSLREQTHGED